MSVKAHTHNYQAVKSATTERQRIYFRDRGRVVAAPVLYFYNICIQNHSHLHSKYSQAVDICVYYRAADRLARHTPENMVTERSARRGRAAFLIYREEIVDEISAKEELLEYRDFYLRAAEKEGPHMALWYTCIAANVPFVIGDLPEDIKKSTEDGVWDAYVTKLIQEGDDKRGARDAEWLDGVTDIRWAFGKELTKKDFSAAINAEKERMDRLPGTKQQRKRWGAKGNGKPFDPHDYNRMDELLDAYASDYQSTGLSERQEQTLIQFVKWMYLADKASEEGDSRTAQLYIKNADMIMASNAMRTKDEKPMDGFRFDACIAALEKAGFMRDGHFLNYEDTCRAIWKFVHPEGNPRYGYSLDVADQVLLNWENNMRKNSGRPEVYELPPEMKTHDDYGEFLDEETEEEKALKQQMDLSTVRFAKGESNADRV